MYKYETPKITICLLVHSCPFSCKYITSFKYKPTKRGLHATHLSLACSSTNLIWATNAMHNHSDKVTPAGTFFSLVYFFKHMTLDLTPDFFRLNAARTLQGKSNKNLLTPETTLWLDYRVIDCCSSSVYKGTVRPIIYMIPICTFIITCHNLKTSLGQVCLIYKFQKTIYPVPTRTFYTYTESHHDANLMHVFHHKKSGPGWWKGVQPSQSSITSQDPNSWFQPPYCPVCPIPHPK